MKIYACESCGQTLFFHNTACIRCGHKLGYLPDQLELTALEPVEGGLWRSLNPVITQHYKMCQNYSEADVCNWMLPAADSEAFCVACRLNQTIPDLTLAANQALWQRLEAEKRRLIYSLMRFGLPVLSKQVDPVNGLAFDFLADDPAGAFSEKGRVFTGHSAGLITINIAEADDAVREEMRQQMDEPYRTVLGHFRHESGHYYWEVLIRDGQWLGECRSLFGDDTLDYGGAMQDYYERGAPGGWQNHYVSAYASSHPWEDWAETWAHYLHIVDTLGTARAFGLQVAPITGGTGGELSADVSFDPYHATEFASLLAQWLPITYAIDSINQSMGQPELYPFVLSPPVIEKLGFVHRVIAQARAGV